MEDILGIIFILVLIAALTGVTSANGICWKVDKVEHCLRVN